MRFKTLVLVYIVLVSYALIVLFPDYSTYFIIALTLVSGLLAIQLLIIYRKHDSNVRCINYVKLLFVLIIYMFFVTLINIMTDIGNYDFKKVIQDIIAVIVLSGGFILTLNTKKNDEYIIKYLKVISIIAIISGIISLSFADFTGGREENIWQVQYILWGLLYPWSSLLLYRLIMKKSSFFWNIAALSTTIMYVILGLLFNKRVVLFDLIIVLIVLIVSIRNKNFTFRLLKILSGSAVIIFLIVFGIKQLFNIDIIYFLSNTWARISNSNNMEILGRFSEFKNLFSEYPILLLITGAGLGSYHNGPGDINIHIGWLNFVFKGGILYAALELWVFYVALKTLFRAKSNWVKYLASCVVFSYIAILVSSSWVASPITLHFSIMKFALLRVADTNDNADDEVLTKQS